MVDVTPYTFTASELASEAASVGESGSQVVLPASGRLILRRGTITKLGARVQTPSSQRAVSGDGGLELCEIRMLPTNVDPTTVDCT